MSLSDVRRTLENQREELDHLRACLLQEYEQLLSARTASISTEAQEVERLQEEMNQLHRMYKLKAKEQPVDDTASGGYYRPTMMTVFVRLLRLCFDFLGIFEIFEQVNII